MVATDMCGKSPLRGSGCMGLRENIHFEFFYYYYYYYYHSVIFIIFISLLPLSLLHKLIL